MGSILRVALLPLTLTGFLIALLPQAADGMGAGCSVSHSHGCTGYGGMMNHPEISGHCDHSYGNTSGNYPGAQNCCSDPGWVATHPPAPPSHASGAGIASSGNDARTVARSVSSKPRAISRSVKAITELR